MVNVVRAAFLLLFFALALSPPEAASCSVEPLRPLYTDERMPADAEAFLRGTLGILQPDFRRYYLAIAYRYLAGGGLTPQDIEALQRPSEPMDGGEPSSATEAWQQARSAVAGSASITYISTYRSNPETHDYYLNCYDDAFLNAAATLRARAAKYGPTSDPVREWLKAQDMVFNDCGQGSSIPAPLPASAGAPAQADRNYQIASAHFYTTQFAEARDEFTAIGIDATSPWRPTGTYLAARAMIRSGALAEAEGQLKGIMGDPALTQMHERAERLLGFVQTRLHPTGRMAEIGGNLAAAHPKDLRQSLLDYTWLYDTLETRRGELEKVTVSDDLTDWVSSFQGGGKPEHRMQRWEAKHSNAWLIAALSATTPNDPSAPRLIAAADQLPPKDPGYLSAQYYAVILLEHGGKNDEVRERLNRLLSMKWPQTSRNLLLAARMKTAAAWQEFLRDAQRQPAGTAGVDYTAFGPEDKRGPARDLQAPGFEQDGALLLNRGVPLQMLAKAANDAQLPAAIRSNLAIASWTRAMLLDDADAAREVTATARSLVPFLDSDLTAFERAAPDAQRFAAVWAMLRNPGLRPTVDIGFGRLTAMNRIDNLRDNWWCSPQDQRIVQPARFLTADQQSAAVAEIAKLDETPAGPSFLGEETLRWAKMHPDDPRLPEALHLVVRAGHYGCTDAATKQYSKRAFDLLHKRFPASEWAKKTPYWFE